MKQVRRRPRSRRRAAAAVLLAIVAVAAVFAAVTQFRRASDATNELHRYDDARQVAVAFGTAYLSYDANDVSGQTDRVLGLATDAFAKDFKDTRVPGLEKLFSDAGTTTTATVTDVFVSSTDGDGIRALVVVDINASSTGKQPQRLVDLTFVLQMVRQKGSWKVDKVAPAPYPNVVGATSTTIAPSGDASTTTSVPAGVPDVTTTTAP